MDGLPKMASAAQINKQNNLDRNVTAKSRQSHRTTQPGLNSVRNKLTQQNSQGLGFSAFDIGISQGINIDYLIKQNNLKEMDRQFTADRGVGAATASRVKKA